MEASEVFNTLRSQIKYVADKASKRDLPARRFQVNTILDDSIRELNNYYLLKEYVTEAEAKSIEEALVNYAISRHNR